MIYAIALYLHIVFYFSGTEDWINKLINSLTTRILFRCIPPRSFQSAAVRFDKTWIPEKENTITLTLLQQSRDEWQYFQSTQVQVLSTAKVLLKLGEVHSVLRKKFFRHPVQPKPMYYQAESLGTLSMLIGWNGLLLVDTSATARSGPTHSFYLNTCKCHFFRIAIMARKTIVMTPNCSQCAISRLKM